MQRIGEQVSSTIQSIFSAEATTPGKRSRRTEAAASGAAPQTPSADSPRPDFTNPQLKWLGQAVAQSQEATLKIFGEHLEERFQTIEKHAATVDDRLSKLENKETSSIDITHAPEIIDITQQLQAMKAKVEASASAAASTSAHHHGEVPYESRTLAIMGNLGFDTPADELEERCKTLLQELGFSQEHWSGIACTRRDGGSACEVVFASPILLQQARLKLKSKRKQFIDGRTVWLDAKKTRSELRPNRMTHRIHEMLEQFEAEQDEIKIVVKNLNTKDVKTGGALMGFCRANAWQWTKAARDRYTPEQREFAGSYAEQS
jgi:hypothetical protein